MPCCCIVIGFTNDGVAELLTRREEKLLLFMHQKILFFASIFPSGLGKNKISFVASSGVIVFVTVRVVSDT